MSLRYLFGAIISIPLLPILYVQGKLAKKRVPKLPDAAGPTGFSPGGKGKLAKVLFIGESTVAGIGVQTLEEGFPGEFSRIISDKTGLSVAWTVFGRTGYTMKQIKNDTLPEVPSEDFDLIVVAMGGNDTFQLNNPISWKKSCKGFITDCQKKFPHTPIAFNCMPPVKEFPAFTWTIKFIMGNLIEILGQELHQLTKSYPNVYSNYQVIKLEDWDENGKYKTADFFSDGVHPSKLTYHLLAKDMAEFVLQSEILKID